MEFLLINHPLDCPICDQGGECDLQDQSLAYGRGFSRYDENKRAVTDKYMGPIIKTSMNRCIQCTRCVRFAEQVAGVEEIGAIGRGENMQITTYLEKTLTSELSGNVADLCPVGALLQKPYSFEARPWELKKTPSIDVHDAVGSNVRLDSRGRQVMRVLPRINEDVNEEWLSDKSRHAIDGMVRRRLDRVYVRRDGKLQPSDWETAFAEIAKRANGSMAAVAGDLVDCETMYAAKALLRSFGSHLLEGRQTGMDYDTSSLSAVNFNTTIAGIEEADAILLIGTNVRVEAPLVNTRIRKAVRRGAKVFAVGPEVDLTYKTEWLGNDLGLLGKLPQAVTDAFAAAERPAVIVGGGGLKAGALGAALALAGPLNLVRDGWKGFNVLHLAASRMGSLLLGYAQKGGIADIVSAAPKLIFFLGADEVDFTRFADSYKVYVGHHGDKGAHHADLVLPAASYVEKTGTFVNLEGRVQVAEKAVFPPGEAREDWKIFRALSDVLGKPLPFDTFEGLRAAMIAEVPELGLENAIVPMTWSPPALSEAAAGPVTYPVADFYMTNAICRASPTMQRCSAEITHGQELAEAAE
jgi:NADH-quinone oxidoreductase subunit G